ncbi:hypothetical protein FRC10_001968 [Ceratobasidium sp. 414]|nr:hypothetical protein FRC10_001968 [Ceratobasidium sp. 414]
MSLMPDEVLQLIASQPVLSFRDLLALSATARRIRSTLKMLAAQPLRVEDPLGTDMLDQEGLGLIRYDLFVATHIRYLCISRPALDQAPKTVTHVYYMDRPKSATHPFPLRSAHFQHSSSYLGNLTHLEISSLVVHSFIFAHLPLLTHLKLSLAEQHDTYSTTQALDVVSAAGGCKLVGFEIGLHVILANAERLRVVDACVSAWPDLEILNLFSLNNGKVPGWFDHSQVKHLDLGAMVHRSQ